MLIKNFSLRPKSFTVAKARPTKELQTQAEALATRLEPALARAVLLLLKAQNNAVTLQALVDAMKSGDIGKVVALVDAAGQAAVSAGGPIHRALQDAVWAAGALAAAPMAKAPTFARAEFHFDRLNPKLVQWVQSYTLDLIRQINTSTRESIRAVLVNQMLAGKSPLDAAREIKTVIGLTDAQAKAVANFRTQLQGFHAKRGAATWGLGKKTDKIHGLQVFKPDEQGLPQDGVIARRLRDFRYDKMLAGAMKSGKPLTPVQIDKMVERYAQKYLAFRARTIARTESLRATNIGIQDAFRQAVDAGVLTADLVRRFWVVSYDERLCTVCAPVPGTNPNGVPLDQPFSTPAGPIFLPPIHPNCRCTVFIQTIEPT